MLQKLREKTTGGWLAVIIVGMLVIPFAFFGVNNYFSSAVATYVAKVGEVEIGPNDFRERFENYRRDQRQALGERYDPQAMDNPVTRREVLERMIDEELLRQAAREAGIVVTADQLREAIASVPAFQVDGRFDQAQYQLLLTAQGMTPRQFERQVEGDLLLRALPAQIAQSALITEVELDDFLRLAEQTRDIEYLALSPPESDPAPITEENVLVWYESHPERYRSEETVAIEYVELRADDVKVTASVDEDSLRRRYEEQKQRYVEPEQRRAAHILVRVPDGADPAAVAAAEARAAELAGRVRAGEDFAALAAEHSDDMGSRSSGGDLGWIERGLLDPAFEAALYALEPGQVSDPVRSSEGWHVIKLLEVRKGREQPFEAVRAQLEQQYLEGERERAFSELSGRLVDASYRDPTSLATTAESMGLEVHTAGPFGRDGGEGIAARPEVIAAAFSRQAIDEGLVSDPIELGPNHMVLLRVTEYSPAVTLPLAEVRERVEADLRQQRQAEAARSRAEALLERARAGESLDSLAEEAGSPPQEISGLRRFASSPDRAIVEAAFSLPPPAQDRTGYALAELSPERFAIVALRAVHDGDPSALDPNTRASIRRELAAFQGDLELRAYLDALRRRIPVKVVEEQL